MQRNQRSNCQHPLDHKNIREFYKKSSTSASWALENGCFWTIVSEKTLESPLDCKKIQPVHPKGNQSWIYIGKTDAKPETPILWPLDAKNWLIWKDRDAGKDWSREEKGTTEDEMVEMHHGLDGHEFEQTPSRWRKRKPVMLHSMGLQRVRYDWATELSCCVGYD